MIDAVTGVPVGAEWAPEISLRMSDDGDVIEFLKWKRWSVAYVEEQPGLSVEMIAWDWWGERLLCVTATLQGRSSCRGLHDSRGPGSLDPRQVLVGGL